MPIIAAMKLLIAIMRLVSLCALLGMLTAPVSTIAAENAMAATSTMETMAVKGMAGMQADGMSCCPDAEPVKYDCGKTCPLVIICTSSPAFALPGNDWSATRISWAPHVFGHARFERLSSLVAEPPARPPKA